MVLRSLINYLDHFRHYWIEPIISVKGAIISWQMYRKYLLDWRLYSRLPGAERLRFEMSYPCLFEAIAITPFDAHYLYQASWAAGKIVENNVGEHVDIGSDVRFVSQLASHLSVTFVDIRPAHIKLERFTSVSGDLLALPFQSRSLRSISCLHVAEHVGLGRYGDGLNPQGTYHTCRELRRVLAQGGNLYFSLPVGRPAVHFNAHRVHAADQIRAYFHDLELIEFSFVDDKGEYRTNRLIKETEQATYSCGLFWFQAT